MTSETAHDPSNGLRPRQMRFGIYAALLAADIAAIIFGNQIAILLRDERFLTAHGLNLWLASLPVFVAIAFSRNAYSLEVFSSPMKGIRAAVYAFLFSSFCVLFATFAMQAGDDLSRAGLITAGFTSFILLIGFRILLGAFTKRVPQYAYLSRIVLCDGVNPKDLTDGTYDISPDIDSRYATILSAEEHGLSPDLNNPAMLDRFGRLISSYDRVYIYCTRELRPDWSLVMKSAGVEGEIVMPKFNRLGGIGIGEFMGLDTLIVSCGPLHIANRIMKRALDLSITVPLMICATIPMLIIALLIKLDSAGPVFFVQERMGRGNQLFKMYKFRSMRTDQLDQSGDRSASRDDDRITRIGRILRATSLDEIPQFINVLQGDMSLVGPRPHALGSKADSKLFWQIDRAYWQRHALKPGITGLAQIRGFRGATETRDDLVNRLGADLEYLSDWTVWTDIGILFATAKVVVHKNAY